LKLLVPTLVGFYVQVEFTNSSTAFYEKFFIRHNIALLLEYLWSVPSHREKWKEFAASEIDGKYLQFVHMIANDLTFMLEEGLRHLQDIRDHQNAEERGELAKLDKSERAEREALIGKKENMARNDLQLAMEYMNLLRYTSTEIAAPLLQDQMIDRIAVTLNYFLLQIIEPQKRKCIESRIPGSITLTQRNSLDTLCSCMPLSSRQTLIALQLLLHVMVDHSKSIFSRRQRFSCVGLGVRLRNPFWALRKCVNVRLLQLPATMR